MKDTLLFYQAYEQFYQMAATSRAFRAFCIDAYGADFSQDGFSDLSQIDRFISCMPEKPGMRVLDVGCGNGKMLRYIQEKTGACIAGFDYSESNIQSAKQHADGDFQVGVMGEINYPQESFDVVTAMDSLYFAPDMAAFVSQIKGWLNPSGLLCAGYQEGDLMPRIGGPNGTALAQALRANQMPYTVDDITEDTYQLMHRKRDAALRHRAALMEEGHEAWFQLLMLQTEHCLVPIEQYRRDNMRCLYVARKEACECVGHG